MIWQHFRPIAISRFRSLVVKGGMAETARTFGYFSNITELEPWKRRALATQITATMAWSMVYPEIPVPGVKRLYRLFGGDTPFYYSAIANYSAAPSAD